MTGKNLFNEGRTRAMEADDEDRPLLLASGLRIRTEEFAGEGLDRFIHKRRNADLSGVNSGGADRVAGTIMFKALFVLPAILISLAKRKMDVKRIIWRKPLADRIAHLGKVAVREMEGLEVGKRPISFAKCRIDSD